jgi:iron-sulfur cluster repair protein YtfE (RIC family)
MELIHDPVTGRFWATTCDLLKYIQKMHHGYLRLQLSYLDRLGEQIARERVVPADVMDRFQRKFTVLADLLEDHLTHQEGWLFPRIGQLCQAVTESGGTCPLEDSLEEAMDQAVKENREALEWLEGVRECLRDARWVGKEPQVKELVWCIQDLADNMATHVHLETDILFPRLQELLHARGVEAMAF